MLDLSKLEKDIAERSATQLKGTCIVLESKDNWLKCQTISSKKIWAMPEDDFMKRTERFDDNSFSFKDTGRANPFGL